MRLTYWLNEQNWGPNHELHNKAEEFGYVPAGFVRPSRYLNMSTGAINYAGIRQHFGKLHRELPSDIPLAVDLEKNSWIVQGNGPITPLEWFKRRRDVAVYMRNKFAGRLIGNYHQPRADHEILVREGCAWTCGFNSIYWHDRDDEATWTNIVTNRFNTALEWQKPMCLYMSPAIWGSGANRNERLANTRIPTGAEYNAMLEMLETLNPEYVIYWQNHPNAEFTDGRIEVWMQLLAQRFADD